MEKSTGLIDSIQQGGSEGAITEDGSQAKLNFINPRIPSVGVGERYEFLKIIQSTPQGEKVINILSKRLP